MRTATERNMNDLDMNSPEVRKNILVTVFVLILLAVIVTVIFTTISWKWGVSAIVIAAALVLWGGRR